MYNAMIVVYDFADSAFLGLLLLVGDVIYKLVVTIVTPCMQISTGWCITRTRLTSIMGPFLFPLVNFVTSTIVDYYINKYSHKCVSYIVSNHITLSHTPLETPRTATVRLTQPCCRPALCAPCSSYRHSCRCCRCSTHGYGSCSTSPQSARRSPSALSRQQQTKFDFSRYVRLFSAYSECGGGGRQDANCRVHAQVQRAALLT